MGEDRQTRGPNSERTLAEHHSKAYRNFEDDYFETLKFVRAFSETGNHDIALSVIESRYDEDDYEYGMLHSYVMQTQLGDLWDNREDLEEYLPLGEHLLEE